MPVPGERWDDTLRRTTAAIRRMYLNHANADLVKVETGGYSDALAEHAAKVYALHGDQGIPPATLRMLWCMVDAFLGGVCCRGDVRAARRRCGPHPLRPDSKGLIWMETAETAYNEETFKSGIEIIIAGIRALAAPDPCDWHTPDA